MPMPKDLEAIVQRMIDAGESEESIGSVIQEHSKRFPVNAPNSPGTFSEGFKKSFEGGLDSEFANTAKSSLLGYAKGAVADLPGGIWNAAKFAGSMVSDPFNTTMGMVRDAPGALKDVANIAAQAGSDPESFGRLMGQTTGQPLVTEGIAKGVPMLRKPAAATVEGAGRIMREHQPISGTLPRIAEPRIMRTIERGAGGMVERAGQSMRPTPPAPKPFDLSSYKGIYGERTPPTSPTSSPLPNVSDIGEVNVGPSQMPKLDSRISSLPPEDFDLPLNTGPSSPSVNQAAGRPATSSVFDSLRLEADRYGLPVQDYIASLRRGGGENFVMPSSELPRVR